MKQLLMAVAVMMAGVVQTPAQNILGKHPADKVLPQFWSQNGNADTALAGLSQYGTAPFTAKELKLTSGGLSYSLAPTALGLLELRSSYDNTLGLSVDGNGLVTIPHLIQPWGGPARTNAFLHVNEYGAVERVSLAAGDGISMTRSGDYLSLKVGPVLSIPPAGLTFITEGGDLGDTQGVIRQTGVLEWANITAQGTVTAATFVGDGSGLTGIGTGYAQGLLQASGPTDARKRLGVDHRQVGAAGDWFWLVSVGANTAEGGTGNEHLALYKSSDGVAWNLCSESVYTEPNQYTNNSRGPIAREAAVQQDGTMFWAVYNFDPYNGNPDAQGLGLAYSYDMTNWTRKAVLYPYGKIPSEAHMFAATWFTDENGDNYIVGCYNAGPLVGNKDVFLIKRLDDSYLNWSAPTVIIPAASNLGRWDAAVLKVGTRYDLYTSMGMKFTASAVTGPWTLDATVSDWLGNMLFVEEAAWPVLLGGTTVRLYWNSGGPVRQMYYAESTDGGVTWPAEPTEVSSLPVGKFFGAGIVRPMPPPVELGTVKMFTGAGAPAIAAPVGSLYLRTDGAANTTLYVKTGAGTSGWTAK